MDRKRNKATKANSPADNKHPVKVDKYASGLSRSFWIVLALCSAAVVLGMGRNEAAPYQGAIEELRALSKLSRNINAVEQRIRILLKPSITEPLVQEIANAAARHNTQVDKEQLSNKMQVFWIADGALSFDFSGPPTQSLKQADSILTGTPYVIKIPTDPATSPNLTNAIEETLRSDGAASRSIIDAGFACNWANDQCEAKLVLSSSTPGENVRRLRFFVQGRTITTSIRPLDVLGLPDARSAEYAFKLPLIRELQNELAGKTFDQSLNYLAQKISEKEGSVKVFDVSFSGITAFLALPIAIVGSLLWLLIQLRELASLSLVPEDLRNEGLEIFYQDRIGGRVVCFVIACTPFLALALLTRLAPSNRLDVVAVVATAAIISAILSYLILRKRLEILGSEIRKVG